MNALIYVKNSEPHIHISMDRDDNWFRANGIQTTDSINPNSFQSAVNRIDLSTRALAFIDNSINAFLDQVCESEGI